MREGWEIKTLADLFDIGSSKRVYESQWRNSGVPFYRAREIVKLSREGFVDNELFIDEDLYNEYANKYGIPKCGDIMVTGVGTLGVCYIVKENDKFYFKDGNTLWFKTKKGTNPFFVNYAFKSYFLRQQIDNCNGATVGTLTIVRGKTNHHPRSTPLRAAHIVSELDLLSSIIEKKKAQLKEYDQLAQSIFYDMFGDPIENPKGWEMNTVGELSLEMRYGTSRPACEDGKYNYLRMGNLTNEGYLNLDDLKKINIPDNEIEKCIVRRGDVLFNRTNSLELIGKTCLFDLEEPMVIAGYLIRVRFKESILPLYFTRLFNLSEIKKKLRSMAKGAVHQANINAKELASIIIPIPPLTFQQSFASKIEAIERQKALVLQSITEAETLFNSRMDYYFN